MDPNIIKQQINSWYHEYSNDIFRYVFFMIGDRDQTNDILQDTFLRAYSHYESFNGENVKSWLFKIARNLTIDFIRKKKPSSSISNLFPAFKAIEKTPEDITIFNEFERQLFISLNRIKRSYKDVIILRKIKEMSISETGRILGWSENKVKVNLFRGMKALRKELEKEGYHNETI
ncbi:RNA polymerase sigma-70 factor [Bacillus oleivorans]|uniref:RNA polymerase sigma-70 factor n=1 Tax=Bacillus oleivorans TaxID=1448271 RepID=A0A285CPY4_9BACI|nr:RNA polymerase sigma factor [Bacillus oleivorans]SNX69607.1 RNA polymerase sigma-70 factor [Bacillus oleivorans]